MVSIVTFPVLSSCCARTGTTATTSTARTSSVQTNAPLLIDALLGPAFARAGRCPHVGPTGNETLVPRERDVETIQRAAAARVMSSRRRDGRSGSAVIVTPS